MEEIIIVSGRLKAVLHVRTAKYPSGFERKFRERSSSLEERTGMSQISLFSQCNAIINEIEYVKLTKMSKLSFEKL